MRRRKEVRYRTVNQDKNEMGCPNFHCRLGPCMCERVIVRNAPKNFVPLPAGHNRGMIGQLLDSPAFKNSPTVEEFCKPWTEYKELQRMYDRIPQL